MCIRDRGQRAGVRNHRICGGKVQRAALGFHGAQRLGAGGKRTVAAHSQRFHLSLIHISPRDENGKIDATKIADANDFGDWEEQGCKG